MFLEILTDDEDVIKVDDNMSLTDKLSQDLIHHPLEGGGQVAETEEHDSGFKQAPVGPGGGLPLVSFLDPHSVVSPLSIQLGEVLSPTQLVSQFLEEEQWIPVLYGEVIQLVMVLMVLRVPTAFFTKLGLTAYRSPVFDRSGKKLQNTQSRDACHHEGPRRLETLPPACETQSQSLN